MKLLYIGGLVKAGHFDPEDTGVYTEYEDIERVKPKPGLMC